MCQIGKNHEATPTIFLDGKTLSCLLDVVEVMKFFFNDLFQGDAVHININGDHHIISKHLKG